MRQGWPFKGDDIEGMERAIDMALKSSVERLNSMRQTARDRVRCLTPELAASEFMDAIHVAVRHKENRHAQGEKSK